ncbi:hypothetical protein [Mangrovibacter phragmitis]|uniref:hypothetical protein n=1 Tax=Mangrovibacter phragmitis TaxID=1691903 RepID=UPI003514A77B
MADSESERFPLLLGGELSITLLKRGKIDVFDFFVDIRNNQLMSLTDLQKNGPRQVRRAYSANFAVQNLSLYGDASRLRALVSNRRK